VPLYDLIYVERNLDSIEFRPDALLRLAVGPTYFLGPRVDNRWLVASSLGSLSREVIWAR